MNGHYPKRPRISGAITTLNDTWPDPVRPGVPLNPEKGGWHWLVGVTERPAAFEWLAHKQAWLFHRAQPEAQAMTPPAFGSWTYLGPVLTPDEAAALQKRVAELGGLAYGLMLAMSASGHDFADILREARAALGGKDE